MKRMLLTLLFGGLALSAFPQSQKIVQHLRILEGNRLRWESWNDPKGHEILAKSDSFQSPSFYISSKEYDESGRMTLSASVGSTNQLGVQEKVYLGKTTHHIMYDCANSSLPLVDNYARQLQYSQFLQIKTKQDFEKVIDLPACLNGKKRIGVVEWLDDDGYTTRTVHLGLSGDSAFVFIEQPNKWNQPDARTTANWATGETLTKIRWHYDADGNCVETLEYQTNGDKEDTILRLAAAYDDHNHMIRYIDFDNGSTIITAITFQYNAKGLETKRIGYTGGLEQVQYILKKKYNRFKHCRKEIKIEFPKDKPKTKRVFRYQYTYWN